jgi:dethiobiotin synthetase
MSAYRPKNLIVVLGTHTSVGKTHVTARWLQHLRQKGLRVSARKPVQSYDQSDLTTDAKQLAAATGEDEWAVCPRHRSYGLAFAPSMAADALQRPRIALADLISELNWPADVDVGIVETAGGPLSPIAHDGDSVDLVKRLNPDRILLIADAGLGTINALRLSLLVVEPKQATVFLNRYDESNDLHRLNREWLLEHQNIETKIAINELDE